MLGLDLVSFGFFLESSEAVGPNNAYWASAQRLIKMALGLCGGLDKGIGS